MMGTSSSKAPVSKNAVSKHQISNDHLWNLMEKNYKVEFQKAIVVIEELLLKFILDRSIKYEGDLFKISERYRDKFHRDLKSWLESCAFVNVKVDRCEEDITRFSYIVELVDPNKRKKEMKDELPVYERGTSPVRRPPNTSALRAH
jgi:deoxyadenosine/deoxycytidine kinase